MLECVRTELVRPIGREGGPNPPDGVSGLALSLPPKRTGHIGFSRRLRGPTASAATLILTACAASIGEVATATPVPPPSQTPAPTAAAATHAVSATASTCTVEAPWSVELRISGGIAGIERKVEVDSSGKYEVEDLQTGEKVEGPLSPARMARVEEGLSGVCLAGDPGRPPACADCFTYSLEVTYGGTAFQAVYNDLSLAGSPMAPLVGTLNQILTESLGS